MALLNEYDVKHIHKRNIDISIYSVDKNRIIVEGTLRDDRLQTTYRIDGEKSPPHTLHHMILRLLVSGNSLTIEDIEVEMPSVPREPCLKTRKMLAPIVGLQIIAGFTKKVKQLVGGPRGCAHLTSLLLTMGPAAVQGHWSKYSLKPPEARAASDRTRLDMTDTCWVWRTGGPLQKAHAED